MTAMRRADSSVLRLSVSAMMSCSGTPLLIRYRAHGALGVLVAARAAQSDDQRSDAAMVELERVIQAGAVDRRGPAVVLRRAQDADGVGGRSLILAGVALNLRVDPAAPAQSADRQDENSKSTSAQSHLRRFGLAAPMTLHCRF